MSAHHSLTGSSVPVHTLDGVVTKNLKAGLRSQSAVNAVVQEALQRYFGKQSTAAEALGMDAAQLSRELRSGDFKLERLDRLEPDAKAFIAESLREALGAYSREDRARRLIRDIRQRCDELWEVVA